MTKMGMFYFLLRCPHCGHDLRYHTDTNILSDKRKRCVYCGKSFSAREHVVKKE